MCGTVAALPRPLTPGHAPHRPRSLPVPGFEGNVLLLRDPTQANAIASTAEGKRVVVIGTSFIGKHKHFNCYLSDYHHGCCYTGMEVAAYLCGKAAGVSCIDITAVPFERVLGARIGKMLQGVCQGVWLT